MKQEIAVNTNSKIKSSGICSKIIKTVKKDWAGWLMLAPCVLAFLIFSWQPIVTTIITSFYETTGFEVGKFVGLDNYISVVTDSHFITTVVNTFEYALWSFIFGCIPPIIIAVFLNEITFMKGYLRAAVYMPNMIPGVAIALMWTIMFDPSEGGLLNMLLGALGFETSMWLNDPDKVIELIVLTMAWRGIGSTVIIYIANLQGVNHDLYEAATLDGAGIFKRIRHVTLPHMSGLIKVMMLLNIINSFKIYDEPISMTGGGPSYASQTLTMLIQDYAFTYFRADKAAAVGVLLALLLGVFSIVYFKYNMSSEEGE
ncbi:MAG: sugar ABC transporter permease [Clostridia bacterium]|nr:sugar ABC transporter permease [Clostridia bacterium]